MKNHLPAMMETGQFTQARLFKVISDQDQGGVSYATQYHCASKKEYDTYIEQYAKALRRMPSTVLVIPFWLSAPNWKKSFL